MHRLQPHVALHTRPDVDHLTSRGLGLLVHPLAWMPIDSDARARASVIGARRTLHTTVLANDGLCFPTISCSRRNVS
jgi:hypothetical protein